MKVSKVTAEDRKLRILLFGGESAGKTDFLLRGPGEVLVFDVEGRIASFAENERIKPFSKVEYDEDRILHDFVEAATEVRRGKTAFKTFGLDSVTDFELRIDRLNGFDTKLAGDSRSPQKQFALADKRTFLETQVLNATMTGPLSAHFVWTAHQKNTWVGRETAGFQPDGTRNLSHYFDLVFNMQLDKRTNHRTAVVTKSNYASVFPVGKIIENLGWDHLEPIIKHHVALDEVSREAWVDAFAKAGYTAASAITQWLATHQFTNPLSTEDKHRAIGMLKTEIEEKSEAAA